MAVIDIYNNYIQKPQYAREGQFKVRQNGELLDADTWVAQQKLLESNKGVSNSQLYSRFWGLRNAAVNTSYEQLYNLQNMPVGSFTKIGLSQFHDYSSYKEIEELARQTNLVNGFDWEKGEWEKAFEISNGYRNGSIFGFDLETMGDIQHGGKATNGFFDVTELAVLSKHYDGTPNMTYDGASYVIGLDAKSTTYYKGLVDKFEREGWDSLNETQQWTLRRASKYATAEFGEYNGLKTVRNLADETMDPAKMRLGIDKLNRNYQDPVTVIRQAAKDIMSAYNDENTVIIGANKKYDYDALTIMLKRIGTKEAAELEQSIRSTYDSNLDVIYSLRALAKAEGVTVEDYLEQVNGIRGGASVQEQLKSYMFDSNQSHFGVSDVSNEIEVAVYRSNELHYKFIDDIQEKKLQTRIMQGSGNKYTADSILYFDSGSLNHESGLEFGTVAGTNGKRYVTPNMSFRGEYWQLDPEHTGILQVDPQNFNGITDVNETKYYATFTNVSDNAAGRTPTSFTIVRDSEEELIEFLEKNTTAYDKETFLTKKGTIRSKYKKLAAAQQEYRYSDLADREFRRLINPTDVRNSASNDPINGFEGLKKYLGLKEQLGITEPILPDSKSASMIYEKALEYDARVLAEGSGTPLKMSYYNAQAYAAMYSRLENESALLKDLVEQIDNMPVKDTTQANFEKTMALRRGYNHAIGYMMDNNTAVKTKGIANVSDFFGIDVEAGGEITRINMSSPNRQAVYDMQNAIKKLNPGGVVDKEGVQEILTGLYQRNLLDAKQYNALMDSSAKLYLQKDTGNFSRQVVEALSITGSEAKAKDRLLQNFGEDFIRERVKKFKGENGTQIAFNDVYINSAHDINVASAIAKTNTTVYFDPSNTQNVYNQMDNLAVRLNLTGNEVPLLGDMFTGGEKGRSYGIMTHSNIGAIVIEPDETHKNAYLLMTRKEDMQKLRTAIDNGDFDFTSYKTLTTGKNSIYDYAAVEELPYINQLALGTDVLDANGNVVDTHGYARNILQTVNQGEEFEKNIIPELKVYTNSEGVTKAYFNTAGYNVMSTHRQVGKTALEEVELGNYHDASRIFRNKYGENLKEMSSSAGYRAVEIDGKFHRIITHGASDYVHGNEVGSVTTSLQAIFEKAVMANAEGITPNDMNTAQLVVYHFGKSIGLEVDNNNYTDFLWKTMHGEGAFSFNEFFQKRAFIGDVYRDAAWQPNHLSPGITPPESFKKNLYNITLDTLHDIIGDSKTPVHGLDRSLITSLEDIPKAVPFELLNQVLPEAAVQKGNVASVKAGSFNPLSESTNTMRPVHTQANQGMPFMPGWLDDATVKRYNLHIGQNPLSQSDLDFREAMKIQNKNPLVDYGELETRFGATVKQMSDWDLAKKYQEMAENADVLYSKLGFKNVDEYNRVFQAFRESYSTLHEDASFMAPMLRDTKLFSSREGIKIKLDVSEDLNFDRTRKTLLSLQNKTVDANTIIGYRKTKYGDVPIYHQGSEVIYSRDLIDKLLPEGVTKENLSKYADQIGSGYALPSAHGDIDVDKLIFNNIEKTVEHSINYDYVAKRADIDLRHAKAVVNNMWDYTFDGAPFVANFGMTGHANPNDVTSNFYWITHKYYEAGKTEELRDYLNTKIAQANMEYSKNGTMSPFYGMKPFESKGQRLIIDMENSVNSVAAWDIVYNDLKNNYGPAPGSDLNKNIIKELDYMADKGLTYGVMQRQNMNEHLGTAQYFDQRIQQLVMLRNMNPEEGELNPISIRIKEAFTEHSENFEKYVKESNLGLAGNHHLGAVMSANNMAKNADRLKKIHGVRDMERSAQGLFISLEDYFMKDFKQLDGVLEIDINDIKPLRGGATTLDMQESIFFTDKGPSQFLIDKAGSKEAAEQVKAIKLNLGQNYTYRISDATNPRKTTAITKDYMIIPAQTVRAQKNSDKHFFQSMASRTNRLVNKTRDLIYNPEENTAAKLSELYQDYHKMAIEQIKAGNKESDLYRAFNKRYIPNSSESQIRDMAAPLTEDMINNPDLQRITKERERLERLIMSGDLSETTVSQYKSIMEEFNDTLKDIGDRIRNDDEYYSNLNFVNLSENVKRAQIVEKNGVKHKGSVISVGKNDLIARGYSFDSISLDVIAEYEKSVGLHVGSGIGGVDEDFIARNNIAAKRRELVNKINALGLDINLNPEESIVQQVDDWMGGEFAVYDKRGRVVRHNTKKINESIADGKKGVKALFDTIGMSEIGDIYMEQIGNFDQGTRYPTFQTQGIVKVLLDPSVQGKETRYMDSVTPNILHGDVDGDRVFDVVMLRGGSVLRTSDQAYKDMLHDWEEFAVGTEINGKKVGFRYHLADMVEGGRAFRKEYVNHSGAQKLALIESIDPEAYEKMATSFLEAHEELGITRADIDDSKSWARFIFASSDEVNDIYNATQVNSYLNENSKIASIAARIRKNNIGIISTPNYMIRDSLIRSLNQPDIDDAQRRKITNTIYDLSTMWDTKGGVLAIFEQDAIDTKKAIDALDIANTARYQTGISGLFAASKWKDDATEILEKSARNITLSGGKKIFGKLSTEQLNQVSKLFATTTYANFNTMLEGIDDKNVKKALEILKGYRGMYEIATEVPVFNQLHNFTKGRLSDTNLLTVIQDIHEGRLDAEIFKNTSGEDMLTKVFKDALYQQTEKQRSFTRGHVYFASGKLFEDIDYEAYSTAHSAFVYDGNNRFTRLGVGGERTKDVFTTREVHNLIDTELPQEVSLGEYKNNKWLREAARNKMNETRQIEILNHAIMKKDGVLRKGFPTNMLIDDKDIIAKNLLDIDGTTTDKIIDKVNTMVHAYEDALSGGIIKPQGFSTSAELLKSINRDIATNPKYHSMKYDEAVYEVMSGIFGDSGKLDRYMQSTLNTPKNFNRKEYLEGIRKLDENIFDVFKAQGDLETSFNNVQRELDDIIRTYTEDAVKDVKEVQNLRKILDHKQETINIMVGEMNAINQQNIKKVQNIVYRQFDEGSFQKQMSAMFQWDTPTNDTVVGFGTYMGKRFGVLGTQDIKNIRTEAQEALSDLSEKFAARHEYAINQTIKALDNYNPAAVPNINFQRTPRAVGDIASKHVAAIKASGEALNNLSDEIIDQARKNADEVLNRERKTVRKALQESPIGDIPDLLKGHGKHVGIAIGAMAAIGIANNLLNRDNNKSPMSPRQSNRHPDDSPNYDSTEVNSQAPASPVAGTGQNTLYMDNQSGLQFKVSGKARREISSASNAQLIATAGGGQMNSTVTRDMSGVNDNWLANKYAELSV